MTSLGAALAAEAVTKRFDNVVALDGVSSPRHRERPWLSSARAGRARPRSCAPSTRSPCPTAAACSWTAPTSPAPTPCSCAGASATCSRTADCCRTGPCSGTSSWCRGCAVMPDAPARAAAALDLVGLDAGALRRALAARPLGRAAATRGHRAGAGGAPRSRAARRTVRRARRDHPGELREAFAALRVRLRLTTVIVTHDLPRRSSLADRDRGAAPGTGRAGRRTGGAARGPRESRTWRRCWTAPACAHEGLRAAAGARRSRLGRRRRRVRWSSPRNRSASPTCSPKMFAQLLEARGIAGSTPPRARRHRDRLRGAAHRRHRRLSRIHRHRPGGDPARATRRRPGRGLPRGGRAVPPAAGTSAGCRRSDSRTPMPSPCGAPPRTRFTSRPSATWRGRRRRCAPASPRISSAATTACPGLARAYGLHFKTVRALLPAVKYQALAAGGVDVIDGYSTDGLIARYDLVVLADDRSVLSAVRSRSARVRCAWRAGTPPPSPHWASWPAGSTSRRCAASTSAWRCTGDAAAGRGRRRTARAAASSAPDTSRRRRAGPGPIAPRSATTSGPAGRRWPPRRAAT